MNELPLSIRDVSPHPDAVRLTGTSPSGVSSGVHTGGAWLWKGEVWKPLDGRPWVNCEHHYPTQEAECLEAMKRQYLFPKNWWVQKRNGRRFLVRNRAFLFPEDLPYSDLEPRHLLAIEQSVRHLNRHGWEIGDDIAIAKESEPPYQLFIYDLSTAYHHTADNDGRYHRVSEESRTRRFFKACGANHLYNLRSAALEALTNSILHLAPHHYRHVYASFYRPVDLSWARFPPESGASCIHTEGCNYDAGIPHTWILTKAPLQDDVIHRYELEWGWSPIPVSD